MNIYVFDRHSKEIQKVEYDDEDELEQIYEDYDTSPCINGVLFLSEDEFNSIRRWKE